jgi:hypothetical protein
MTDETIRKAGFKGWRIRDATRICGNVL